MKKTFTHFSFLTFLLIFHSSLVNAQIKIGDNVNTINASSLLEMESTSKGLLFTRMSTSQMNAVAGVKGLVIFNTDSNCLFNYTGTSWISLCRLPGNQWYTGGNSIASSSSTFLGTSNSTDLVFRTNNTERMRIDSATGNLGVGTKNPLTTLSVFGGLTIGKCDTFNLLSNNRVLNIGNNSSVFLTSNNNNPVNRIFTISNGLALGQILIIANTDTDANDDMRLANSGNVKLSSNWSAAQDDTIVLIWNGTYWLQIAESNN